MHHQIDAKANGNLALPLAARAAPDGEDRPASLVARPSRGPIIAADQHRGDAVIEVAEGQAFDLLCVSRCGLHPDGVIGVATREILQQVKRPRQHVIRGHRFKRRDVQGARQFLQSAPHRRGGAKAANIAVAGVKDDHAARAQVAVQLGIGRRGRGRLGLRNGPIDEREKGQLVGLKIHLDGVSGLDGGAPEQAARQARKAQPGGAVQRGVAGFDVSQHDLGGRLQRADVFLLRAGFKGQRQGQQHHGGGGRAAETEAACQPEGGQNIQHQQHDSAREQQTCQRRFSRQRHAFDGHGGGPACGGQFVIRADHVQRHAAAVIAVEAGAQVGAEHALHQHLAIHTRNRIGTAHATKPVEHVFGLPCGACQLFGA